jgi:hypothetical protein
MKNFRIGRELMISKDVEMNEKLVGTGRTNRKN